MMEYVMRYFPAAAALSMLAAVTASVSYAEIRQADPRAVMLVEMGRGELAAGDVQGAIDFFESALAVDPGHTAIYLDLAEAARAQDLQGKAIHYYREALRREPANLAAISGEGEALLEKGAVEKARRNLARLQALCGSGCVETRELAAALDRGPPATIMAAEMISPDNSVTQN